MTLHPSRRTLLQAAAWGVPAVSLAATAPAFASSTAPVACAWTTQRVKMASFAPVTFTGGDPGATVVTTSTSRLLNDEDAPEPVTVTITTVFDANTGPTATKHLSKFGSGANESGNLAQNDGGPENIRVNNRDTMLKFAMRRATGDPKTPNDLGMTVTVSFSPAVTDLEFTITDVDSNSSNQYDTVHLTSLNGGAVDHSKLDIRLGSRLDQTSLGTESKPWKVPMQSDANQVANNSADGNVRVRVNYTDPITEFTFVYKNIAPSASETTLNLANLTFAGPQFSGC